MKRSANERFSDRLKGGLLLLAIVFGILVISGGPTTTSPAEAEAGQLIVPDPTNHYWDAY